MSTQQELDLQARLADMERQIAELAAKVNPLYSGGMDRYIHSGYLQFDGIPIRWDTKGQQVESNGISRASVYFVNKLVPSPSGETERVELVGSVDSTSTLTSLNAIHSGGLGGVLLGAASGTANAELTIFVSGWSNQPRAKLYPLTTDIGKLELQDAVLSFAGLASDPGTLSDGLMWYNTTTDKLYARINGATVELGGGGGLKTSGGGYYLIPAGPAAGTGVSSSASADTYGSWVEMRSASGNALYIVGIEVQVADDSSVDYVQVDIATGAAASESSVGEAKIIARRHTIGVQWGTYKIELPYPIPVAASTRIACRTADDVASALSHVLTLHVIDQADVVSI